MSTARALLLVLLVGCGGKKDSDSSKGASCLPPATADNGAGIGAVDGVKATACWAGICLQLDREGKVIGPIEMPARTQPPQVQQDRQIGDKAYARRDPGGQWMIEDVATGKKVPIGAPHMKLEFFEPTWVVLTLGNKLHFADAVKEKEVADFTLPGTIAMVVPWFDQLLIVLEKPAGTARLDPASATLYQGAELPRCR